MVTYFLLIVSKQSLSQHWQLEAKRIAAPSQLVQQNICTFDHMIYYIAHKRVHLFSGQSTVVPCNHISFCRKFTAVSRGSKTPQIYVFPCHPFHESIIFGANWKMQMNPMVNRPYHSVDDTAKSINIHY